MALFGNKARKRQKRALTERKVRTQVDKDIGDLEAVPTIENIAEDRGVDVKPPLAPLDEYQRQAAASKAAYSPDLARTEARVEERRAAGEVIPQSVEDRLAELRTAAARRAMERDAANKAAVERARPPESEPVAAAPAAPAVDVEAIKKSLAAIGLGPDFMTVPEEYRLGESPVEGESPVVEEEEVRPEAPAVAAAAPPDPRRTEEELLELARKKAARREAWHGRELTEDEWFRVLEHQQKTIAEKVAPGMERWRESLPKTKTVRGMGGEEKEVPFEPHPVRSIARSLYELWKANRSVLP